MSRSVSSHHASRPPWQSAPHAGCGTQVEQITILPVSVELTPASQGDPGVGRHVGLLAMHRYAKAGFNKR
ncbi:MAG: hypothetical protein CM15mP74_36250 [Halieaceae bacterium]|nr:MAG: hypothetical protein CM15mP74_36250 [Halieaceae bacterium]